MCSHHTRECPTPPTCLGRDFEAIILITAILPSPLACPCQRVFEAIILIAGLQPDADIQLAVMGILFSTHSLVFMVNGGRCTGRTYGYHLSSAHGRHPRTRQICVNPSSFSWLTPVPGTPEICLYFFVQRGSPPPRPHGCPTFWVRHWLGGRPSMWDATCCAGTVPPDVQSVILPQDN